MHSNTTFDSTKEFLSALLQDIKTGKIQLPDFQRGWVWDDEHIKGLLASISMSYPIGAVMMLEVGNSSVRFKPRLLEGVMLPVSPEPDQLILDGQQRFTSLFQALYSGRAVETRDNRKNSTNRWYYINIEKILSANGDREEAIVSLPEERILRNFRREVVFDYSTAEQEYRTGLFPLSQVFDCSEWQTGYSEFWDYSKDKLKLFNQFNNEVIKRFERYQLPMITLKKETTKDAVCLVFEKVNTGGVPLTVFELLTATYAVDNYNLRDDWSNREKRLHKHKVLRSLENTDFLQAIALVSTYAAKLRNPDTAVSCKRKDILHLDIDEYKYWAEPVTQGFESTAKLLYAQKIFAARDLPYRSQLVPLAAVLAMLGDKADSDGVKAKLSRWYWCGVFGELYGGAIETRFARDLPEIVEWINGGPYPTTIVDANFTPGRLLTLQNRNSAAYKGLYALLIKDGGQDFRSGTSIDVQMYFDDKIDIHHIFPQAWCKKNGINAKRCDSIVNKTPLSAKTNRIIGGNQPSLYLSNIQKNAGIRDERMDQILRSHVIEPPYLRANDFATFFTAREGALLDRIERAMGKSVARNVMQDSDVANVNDASEYQEEEESGD